MSLSSLLPQLPRTTSTAKKCALSAVVAAMNATDRTAFDQALRDRHLSASVLSEALRKSGFDISDQMIRRHRNDLCATCRNS